MRSTMTRPWLATLLLLAVFSSFPFGSMEQPSAAAGTVAASAVVDGASLTPSPGTRGLDGDGLPPPPRTSRDEPHPVSHPAPPAAPTRDPPPATPPPHLSYDALAPPRT